jgi:glycerol 3-phosphatase-2
VAQSPLQSSPSPLARRFDVALLDLDGVVYVGADAVEGAPAALAAARAAGMRLAFVTNNAARPPSAVAEHLTRLGIAARTEEVITSSQAAAHYLADRLPAGAAVLVVGTVGLEEALHERGLRPVSTATDEVAAVVQGYSPELDWNQLAEGAVAIRRGVPWVATNLDVTVPSPRGPLPGNGSLVAALRTATGVEPVSTGKPDPTMHRESVLRSAAQRPIVVGDRLDTDVEGANAVGCASLLVFTGVTVARDLLAAPPDLRPTFLSHDVSGLLSAHRSPVVDGAVATCGSWTAVHDPTDGGLRLERHDQGTAPRTDDQSRADDLDGLRALCAVVWATGPAAGSEGPPQVTAADAHAAHVLAAWDLAD